MSDKAPSTEYIEVFEDILPPERSPEADILRAAGLGELFERLKNTGEMHTYSSEYPPHGFPSGNLAERVFSDQGD